MLHAVRQFIQYLAIAVKLGVHALAVHSFGNHLTSLRMSDFDLLSLGYLHLGAVAGCSLAVTVLSLGTIGRAVEAAKNGIVAKAFSGL